MNRSDYWRSAGHPIPNTVPLTSTYDGCKQVPQPAVPERLNCTDPWCGVIYPACTRNPIKE